jgi:flavodoxin
MKYIRFTLLAVALLCTLTACAQQKQKTNKAVAAKTFKMTGKKVLVAYFSRADENYNVGYIKKGNTSIVADMIARETGAQMFHIVTVHPYPAAYEPCIKVAQQEMEDDARPAIKGDARVEDYDVIFIGYPIWWGEPPMAVFTFMDKHSWKGKTVVPFCTHEGSGLGATEASIKSHAKGATVLRGLAVRGTDAQRSADKVLPRVKSWLSSLR